MLLTLPGADPLPLARALANLERKFIGQEGLGSRDVRTILCLLCKNYAGPLHFSCFRRRFAVFLVKAMCKT
jgi:hypothetical protein